MAPTVQNGVNQPAFTTSKLPQRPSVFKKSMRRVHELYQQRSVPKLWRRQILVRDAPPNSQKNSPGPHANGFEPYLSPIPLHANIIPLAMPTSSDRARFGHLSITELILISSGAFIAIILGVIGLVMMRTTIVKKGRRFLSCGRRRQKNSKTVTEDKGTLVMNEEFDDPTWGTPPRKVYVEGINDRREDHHSADPFSNADSPPSSPSTPIWREHSQYTFVREEDNFQERFDDEENAIGHALTQATGVTIVTPKELVVPAPSASTDASFASLGHLENVSIFKSLQASIDDLAKGISSPIPTRPRQGSDASATSQATTASSPDVVDRFSVSSSGSSMTSIESSGSSLEDPEEMEVAYEVRRAHAQSIELKKGVLVTCQRTSSIHEDALVSGMLPTFIISEAAPSLLPLDDQNFASLFSLRNSVSSKASIAGSSVMPSLSSIVRENSGGVMASLSTATTHTDGWCLDDEKHLQPPIPCLMLTRPSDSSIYTSESCTSTVSVDLCDFPLPPIPAKPSYYSKLVDQVQHAPKRIWDNHFTDSSADQKRSTVERFIMMYSSG